MTDPAVLKARDREALERWPSLASSNPEIVATLSHFPGRLDRFVRYYAQVVEEGLTPRRLKDVMERRVAELHELERRGELPSDPGALEPPEGLADDELALVRFIDAYAIDHNNVPEAIFAELHRHFSAAELTEILWTTAVTRSMSRVAGVLGLEFATSG